MFHETENAHKTRRAHRPETTMCLTLLPRVTRSGRRREPDARSATETCARTASLRFAAAHFATRSAAATDRTSRGTVTQWPLPIASLQSLQLRSVPAANFLREPRISESRRNETQAPLKLARESQRPRHASNSPPCRCAGVGGRIARASPTWFLRRSRILSLGATCGASGIGRSAEIAVPPFCRRTDKRSGCRRQENRAPKGAMITHAELACLRNQTSTKMFSFDRLFFVLCLF